MDVGVRDLGPPLGRSVTAGTAGTDPLTVPAVTHAIGSCAARERVVVRGVVVAVQAVRWVGGVVLEVDVRDVSGAVRLAFLGRRAMGGVAPGVVLTAAGTVGLRDGLPLMLNPLVWLAGSHQGHDGCARHRG